MTWLTAIFVGVLILAIHGLSLIFFLTERLSGSSQYPLLSSAEPRSVLSDIARSIAKFVRLTLNVGWKN